MLTLLARRIWVLHAVAHMVHVVAQSSTHQLGVCLGNGDGTFRAGSLTSTDDSVGSTLTSLVVVDVNNDGYQVCQLAHTRKCSAVMKFARQLYMYVYVIVCSG